MPLTLTLSPGHRGEGVNPEAVNPEAVNPEGVNPEGVNFGTAPARGAAARAPPGSCDYRPAAAQGAAAGQPATRAAAGDPAAAAPDPDYRKWAALENGSWMRVHISGTLPGAEWTIKLDHLTTDEAVLQYTEVRSAEPRPRTRQERVPATSAPVRAARAGQPGEVLSGGEEVLTAGNQALACGREPRRFHDGDDQREGTLTTWTSAAVPGFVRRPGRPPSAPRRAAPPRGGPAPPAAGRPGERRRDWKAAARPFIVS